MIVEHPDHVRTQRDVLLAPLNGRLDNAPRVQLLNQYGYRANIVPDHPTPQDEVYRVIDMHGCHIGCFTTFDEAATQLFNNTGWGNRRVVNNDEIAANGFAIAVCFYAAGRDDNYDDQMAMRAAAHAHALDYHQGDATHMHSVRDFYTEWHKENDR